MRGDSNLFRFCAHFQLLSFLLERSFVRIVLSVQKVLSSSGRATRRWTMYFPIQRSLLVRPEQDNTFWTNTLLNRKFLRRGGRNSHFVARRPIRLAVMVRQAGAAIHVLKVLKVTCLAATNTTTNQTFSPGRISTDRCALTPHLFVDHIVAHEIHENALARD